MYTIWISYQFDIRNTCYTRFVFYYLSIHFSDTMNKYQPFAFYAWTLPSKMPCNLLVFITRHYTSQCHIFLMFIAPLFIITSTNTIWIISFRLLIYLLVLFPSCIIPIKIIRNEPDAKKVISYIKIIQYEEDLFYVIF